MRNASGVVKIPLLVAVLLLAAGGAVFRAGTPASDEAVEPASVQTLTSGPAANEADPAFLGEMVVSASRIRD